VGEGHLDLLALPGGVLERFGLGKATNLIAQRFIDISGLSSRRRLSTSDTGE
jgi:hypothetical protein